MKNGTKPEGFRDATDRRLSNLGARDPPRQSTLTTGLSHYGHFSRGAVVCYWFRWSSECHGGGALNDSLSSWLLRLINVDESLG